MLCWLNGLINCLGHSGRSFEFVRGFIFDPRFDNPFPKGDQPVGLVPSEPVRDGADYARLHELRHGRSAQTMIEIPTNRKPATFGAALRSHSRTRVKAVVGGQGVVLEALPVHAGDGQRP